MIEEAKRAGVVISMKSRNATRVIRADANTSVAMRLKWASAKVCDQAANLEGLFCVGVYSGFRVSCAGVIVNITRLCQDF